ncbi:YbaB/EbfC family nucleoid-associated protein [Amycolatopsis australiensis]|uniref:YbaB/EbfC family nucleoid-associated protein n=1 Tax=Amycolatopsis australiensis TaxID=546364 RepID=UPI000930AA05|nr:YbaB/EbfC family nucleoid-associated protein [Amycolatopsis australiensis]
MNALGRDLRLVQQQAGELDARLAAARHTGRPTDQLVTAVVTGQGALLDLRIENRALAGTNAHKLGCRSSKRSTPRAPRPARRRHRS